MCVGDGGYRKGRAGERRYFIQSAVVVMRGRRLSRSDIKFDPSSCAMIDECEREASKRRVIMRR